MPRAKAKLRRIRTPPQNKRRATTAKKNAPDRRKQKNPFPQTQSRAPKRTAARVKSRKSHKTAAPYAKLTETRRIRTAGIKSQQPPQAAGQRVKSREKQRFYNSFAKSRGTRQSPHAFLRLENRPAAGQYTPYIKHQKSAPVSERVVNSPPWKLRAYFPIIISPKTFASFSMWAISMCSFGMWAQSIS